MMSAMSYGIGRPPWAMSPFRAACSSPKRESVLGWMCAPSTTISLLMDAVAPADIAAPTSAGPPAALPTDAGSSSWMVPPSNDVFTMSDVFGRFDPWAAAPNSVPAGPPASFRL
eukprot:4261853-Pyramimonas_sp.AAC.1